MNIIYVSSRGQRRSPALAAYTQHILNEEYVDDILVGYTGIAELNSHEEMQKHARRLRRIAKIKTSLQDRNLIERTTEYPSLVNPRIAYLLLEQGIQEILEVPELALQARTENDILLAVDQSVQRRLRNIGIEAETVHEFIGQKDAFGIPDVVYWWPTTSHQLKKDRDLCKSLWWSGVGVADELLLVTARELT